MKITQIKLYQVDLPLKEGRYSWSGGKSVDVFDSTVVCVTTDSGLEGWERYVHRDRPIFPPLPRDVAQAWNTWHPT